MKPFSTSVIQDLIRIFATTTKICANDGSISPYGWHFNAHHQTLLLTKTSKYIHKCITNYVLAVMNRQTTRAPSIFRANCFGRWVVTHSLADDNFHVHRPAVFSNQHLLWCLRCVVYLGALSSRLVHPTAPVLLTKTWPTGHNKSKPYYKYGTS